MSQFPESLTCHHYPCLDVSHVSSTCFHYRVEIFKHPCIFGADLSPFHNTWEFFLYLHASSLVLHKYQHTSFRCEMGTYRTIRIHVIIRLAVYIVCRTTFCMHSHFRMTSTVFWILKCCVYFDIEPPWLWISGKHMNMYTYMHKRM